MAKDEKTRILRVGIIQDRRVVEERLLRKHEDVSVGTDSKNTFIVPGGKLPRATTVFEARPKGYALVFERGMEGRIDLGDKPTTLKELARSKKATKRGKGYVLPLNDTSKGKVVIGDTTMLFQFVDAPPVILKTTLPAATRAGVSAQLEWPLIYILIVSMLVIGGGGVGLDVWWRQTGQYMDQQSNRKNNRLYETLRVEVEREKEEKEEKKEEEKKEEKEEEKKEEEKKEEEPKEEEPKVEEIKPPEPAPAPKPQPRVTKRKKKVMPKAVTTKRATSRKKLTQKVRSKTFLRALGGQEGGGPGALAGLQKGVHSARLDDAFNLQGGVTSTADGSSTFIGGPAATTKSSGERYKTIGKGEVGGKRIKTATVKTTSKERGGSEIRVRANVKGGNVAGKSGTGQINKSSVARVFARRKGAIKYCYEKALKTKPKLKGKVTIRFTIGTAGRITTIKASSNSTGDSGVAKCIIGKVKGWRFEPPKGGSVTFSYPFLLDTR